jgi:predicted metal-dependent phosphoesterase TrpH
MSTSGPPMRTDLHIHTTASDGEFDPHEIVEAAIAGGLDLIAITDHDTTAAVAPARAAAAGTSLQVLSGSELSSTWNGREIHVLGYGLDCAAPAIEAHRVRARRIRLDRMAAMLEALHREEGIEVELDAVLAMAGPNREMVGRPHLARVLVERGHASDVRDAFDRYIADHRPAFVPTALQSPFEAIETILGAGGVPVWAHPPMDLLADLLPLMVEAGLRGLEVHRSGAPPTRIRRLSKAARESGLVTSGGSDWHNLRRNAVLGHFWVGSSKIVPLLDLLGIEAFSADESPQAVDDSTSSD